MSKIRAFIFDLDGVITDTAEYHFRSWKRLADEEGYLFTREDNDELRGVSRRESLIRLLKGKTLPEAKMQELMQRKNEYYIQYLDDISPTNQLPGVSRFLQDAHSASLKIGLGSASKNARPVLEKLGLNSLFHKIGDGYSVMNSKPAPDIFVWVAGGLGVNVDQAVVFEDAAAGIDAGKAAGCLTVGIGAANVQHAHLVLPNLASMSVAEVLEKLGS
jgi:beta-phosphoglucomutase